MVFQEQYLGPFDLANTSTHNNTEDPRVEEARYVAYGIIAPIIISVGLVGNLLTIIILRLPQFRGVTYTYFLALAISDFLSLTISISLLHHLLVEATPLYSTAVWWSYCEILFDNIPLSTSVVIVACIAIDRFFSVCRPTDFKRIHTSRYARAGILGSVILAVVIWLPVCALKEPKLYNECETSSFVPPDNRTWWVACMKIDIRNSFYFIAYQWIRQTIVTFVPIIVLTVSNTLIVKEFIRLRKRKDQMSGSDQLQDNPVTESRRRNDQHLVSLLMAVMISFFITQVPSGVLGALYTDNLAGHLKFEIFRAVANNLELLNHALNFYLYVLCSKPIRDTIKYFFHQHNCLSTNFSFPEVMEVARQPTKKSPDFVKAQVTSTTKANIVRHEQEVGGSNKHALRKSKTVSRETEPSNITSDRDSSPENVIGLEISSCAKLEHSFKNTITGSTESPHLERNTVDCEGKDEIKIIEHEYSCVLLDAKHNIHPDDPKPPFLVTEMCISQKTNGNISSANTQLPQEGLTAHLNGTFELRE
ncbi:probable G-protein coupled receptor B0563.6 [Homarus americanus]|uniref:probable G-protein coupled receptor B0563.6 n=1 Tax=Homarus americanus TaxID=6706 RepID=UPI001C437805|nr:probable G-protein coupled receptor B0563.6 [Homarus americanus]